MPRWLALKCTSFAKNTKVVFWSIKHESTGTSEQPGCQTGWRVSTQVPRRLFKKVVLKSAALVICHCLFILITACG
jgi:hypothetical protein